MAIGSVIQRGMGAYVYDENGRQTIIITMSPTDSLQGYTGSTISIRRGSSVYIYDERGSQKSIIVG
jgi:hypothetical protein